MIPHEIDREAVIAAAGHIDSHGIPDSRASRHWDVLIKGRSYPPKYLISVAAKMAVGKAWPSTKFIATEARVFLATRGFEVRKKSAVIAKTGVSTETAILLRWKDPEAFGFVDILPLSFFAKKRYANARHEIRGPQGGQSFALCNVKTHGLTAELDYEAFPAFNRKQDNELGVARLTFADSDRTTISMVEWKRIGETEFKRFPFDIPEYQAATEPPYVQPTKASKKVLKTVRERPGQIKFRRKLKAAYGHSCCITGCPVAEALEGAHIDPYLGPDSDNVRNGLLLRRDLHALFDKNLIGIEPSTRAVRLAPELRSWPDYLQWDGRELVPPTHPSHYPDAGALERRWAQFTTAWSK